MKNTKVLLISIYTFGFICLAILSLFLSFDAITFSFYKFFSSLAIIISYFASAIYFCKNKGFISITNLFWICLFTFGLVRLLFYILGFMDFTNYKYGILGVFTWTQDSTIIVLFAYYCFMFVFSFFSIKNMHLCSKRKRITEGKISDPFYAIFFISALITIYYYFCKLQIVNSLGYVSLYNGQSSLRYESILSLFRLVFVCSFYFIVTIESRKNKIILSMFTFLIVNFIPVLQGSRAEFIIYLFSCAYLYSVKFDFKIKPLFAIGSIIVFIPLLELVSYIRSGVSISNNFLANSYTDFFSELSGSFNIPAYYLQNKDSLSNNSYPYIFEPLVKVFQYFSNINIYSSGQSEAMIAIRFNLGHQITYNISSGYYLQGHNFASNFIAEMLEFGIFGVFVFSIIFSFLVNLIERKILERNYYWTFMFFEMSLWLFFAPRGSAFFDTYNLLKFSLIYFAGMFVLKNSRLISSRKISLYSNKDNIYAKQ